MRGFHNIIPSIKKLLALMMLLVSTIPFIEIDRAHGLPPSVQSFATVDKQPNGLGTRPSLTCESSYPAFESLKQRDFDFTREIRNSLARVRRWMSKLHPRYAQSSK